MSNSRLYLHLHLIIHQLQLLCSSNLFLSSFSGYMTGYFFYRENRDGTEHQRIHHFPPFGLSFLTDVTGSRDVIHPSSRFSSRNTFLRCLDVLMPRVLKIIHSFTGKSHLRPDHRLKLTEIFFLKSYDATGCFLKMKRTKGF